MNKRIGCMQKQWGRKPQMDVSLSAWRIHSLIQHHAHTNPATNSRNHTIDTSKHCSEFFCAMLRMIAGCVVLPWHPQKFSSTECAMITNVEAKAHDAEHITVDKQNNTKRMHAVKLSQRISNITAHPNCGLHTALRSDLLCQHAHLLMIASQQGSVKHSKNLSHIYVSLPSRC